MWTILGDVRDVGLIKRHNQEIVSTNQDDPDEEEGVEDQDDEHWYLQNCEMLVVQQNLLQGVVLQPASHRRPHFCPRRRDREMNESHSPTWCPSSPPGRRPEEVLCHQVWERTRWECWGWGRRSQRGGSACTWSRPRRGGIGPGNQASDICEKKNKMPTCRNRRSPSRNIQ